MRPKTLSASLWQGEREVRHAITPVTSMCTHPAPGATLIRYASRPAGNCLIAHTTENRFGTEQSSRIIGTAPHLAHRSRDSFSRSLFHVRALLRLAQRRPVFWHSGLAVGTGSAIYAGDAGHGGCLHGSDPPVAHRAAIAAGVVPLSTRACATGSADSGLQQSLTIICSAFQSESVAGTGLVVRVLCGMAAPQPRARRYDETKMTAAHKTLPLGTLVRVTNLSSQQSVVVRINDRGTLGPEPRHRPVLCRCA